MEISHILGGVLLAWLVVVVLESDFWHALRAVIIAGLCIYLTTNVLINVIVLCLYIAERNGVFSYIYKRYNLSAFWHHYVKLPKFIRIRNR